MDLKKGSGLSSPLDLICIYKMGTSNIDPVNSPYWLRMRSETSMVRLIILPDLV